MIKKLLIGLIVAVSLLAQAQSFYAVRHQRNLSAYVGSGTASYMGDMVNPKSLGKVSYNIVAGSEYFITQRFSARAELVWFRVAGSDASANDSRITRNLSFVSNCQEISLGGTFYFLPEQKNYFQRLSFNMYAFAGAGIFRFNPKAEYQGKYYSLQPLRTENIDYNRISVTVPYGLGVRLRSTPLMNILIELGYRTTFTDYMDDVSDTYIDPALLSSDLSRALADRRRERNPSFPAGVSGGIRGNPKNNDGYLLMNIKVQYYLAGSSNFRFKQTYRKKRKSFNPKRS